VLFPATTKNVYKRFHVAILFNLIFIYLCPAVALHEVLGWKIDENQRVFFLGISKVDDGTLSICLMWIAMDSDGI
jgi:hypothetical protein